MEGDNSGGPHDGRVYVTWTRYEFDSYGSYLASPIYLAYSDDRAVTWTVVGEINGVSSDLCEYQTTNAIGEPLEVTNDPPVRDQWFPWVTVSDNGMVHIVYHDRREDPNNLLTNTYVAMSQNGGKSWTERRVTKIASDYLASYFGLCIFKDDYNNIAARGNKAYALWTDARAVFDTDIFMQVVKPGRGF